MAFLNPLLLFGLAAILVPLIIHLLARRPDLRTAWATMRFVKAAVAANQGKSSGKAGLLLTLRCAFLALLALALAQPVWRRGGSAQGGSGEVAAILLLDQSASMAQTDGATSRFAQAQQAAEQVLDSLPSGSAAALWLVSDEVKPVIAEPTNDLSLVRQVIPTTARTDRGNDWQPAIQRALDALAQQKAAVKQLYVITDGQASGWKAPEEITTMLAAAKSKVQTRVILAGDTVRRNLAITDLRLTSAIAAMGELSRFEAEVSNFGVEGARNVTVTLAADAEAPSSEQTLETIAPGESKRVLLSVTLRSAGIHTITVRGPADGASRDNARTIALRAIDKVNVLIVDGDPGSEPRESDAFYLQNALAPVVPEQRGTYFIQTKTISPTELEAQKLAEFAAVILADVTNVSDATLGALEEHLRGGGGLIVFPGPKTNPAFYNAAMHVERGFLPAAFEETRGNADQDQQFFQLQSKGNQHRMTQSFNAGAGSPASAHFFRAFTLAPGKSSVILTDAGPPVTVLNFTDRQPAIMERAWGRGRVVQFSSTAGSKWNDLCLRSGYVPLVHGALGAVLARQDERLNGRCGTKFTLDGPAEAGGREVRISKPGGSVSPAQVSAGKGRTQFVFDDTGFAGAYEARLGDDTKPFIRFATQIDREESKLAEFSESDLKALEAGAQVTHWIAPADFRAKLAHEQTGMEFWLPLAVLGLVVAAGETVLGNRWSRTR